MIRHALALMLVGTLAGTASAAPKLAQSVAPAPVPDATSCKLTYYNGPLIQRVKVFDVFYNQGNPYKDMLAQYYTSITQSAYFDWLVEYNTTNYKISRGSFLGTYEDTNSATASVTLDDTDIGPYLDKLIAAGKIPAPDDNTIYQIHFPASVTITLQGAQSCVVFCAYHNSYMHGNQIARYSVIPDVTKAPCAGGCGTSPTQFNNLSSVSSHELIEAVTDPDNNTAWVDQTQGCGEIGDICNGKQCTPAVTGQTPTQTTCPTSYVVQLEYSNSKGCIAQDPSMVVNAFTVAASPATVNVPAGGMATTAVNLTKTTGSAENVKLSTTMLPMGLTASFSPTSVTSDKGTSMLTISAAPTAMVGTMEKVTITATGSVTAPTADVMVQIVPPVDMAMPPDMAQPVNSGGGGNGGNGTGGNGNNGNGNGGNNIGGSSGCSMGGAGIGGSWAAAALLLLGLAFRRRRA